MTDTDTDILLSRAGLDAGRTERLVAETLSGADDGELYLEHRQTESFSFDDGRLKNANFDTSQGFGLRAVAGEKTGYAHATEISEDAIGRAAASLRAVKAGHEGTLAEAPLGTNKHLYPKNDPVADGSFESKVALLQEIDAYARAKDPRVRQVSASLQGELQRIEILRLIGGQPSFSYGDYAGAFDRVTGKRASFFPGTALDEVPVETMAWAPAEDGALAEGGKGGAGGRAGGECSGAELRREALDSLRRDAGWRLYDCPCGARLKLPGELAGERSVACPRCGQVAGA